MKLEINYRKKKLKTNEYMEAKKYPAKHQWVNNR